MRTRNSFWAQLGQETFESPGPIVHDVRTAMLQALQAHPSPGLGTLEQSIRSAPDLAALWALRPELAHALDHVHGAAEQELQHVMALFNGHFAHAISSRFGAL